MTEKQILDWQEKVRASLSDEAQLLQYLFQTMDNFYYRYIETTTEKNLKTISLGPHLWGARSIETSMVDALKIKNPMAKPGIIEMAKAVPKAQGPAVHYKLLCDIEKLTPDQGKIRIISGINWDWPDFEGKEKQLEKVVNFTYSDLGQFRKELALKLEEACEIFL